MLSKLFAALMTAIFASVTLASSVWAYIPDDGDEVGEGLTVVETLTWFVGFPTIIWLVIWFFWSMPKWRKSARPKTGAEWNPEPSSDVVSR
jgi:hypothetical protein